MKMPLLSPTCATRLLLPLLLLATLPAAVQAQFNFTTNNGTITITGYTGAGGDVIIPDKINELTVSSIGDYAFFYCTSLTKVTIPNSVTSIGDKAFAACWNLTTITVGTLNSSYSSIDGVLFNESQATLIQCPGGKAGSYTIPDSVISIGAWAFEGCFGLTNITIGKSVTSIGELAFSWCRSLTAVTIPPSVNSIGDRAFSGCSSLTTITVDALNSFYSSVDGVLFNKSQTTLIDYPQSKAGYHYTIPTSVTSIEGGAFAGCKSLSDVTIPNGVDNIGDFAFEECDHLRSLYFEGNAPSLGEDVFSWIDTYTTVYYLPGATGWGTTFGDRPTAFWQLPYPVILSLPPTFGVRTNQFGFRISWANHAVVLVEASATLHASSWTTVANKTLINGWSYFSDPVWANYPRRFYRLRSP